MFDPEVIAAAIALVASLAAAAIAITGQRNVRRLEADLRAGQESAAFLEQKLSKFYLPLAMHLTVTKKLFDRFFAAASDEQSAIEHEMRLHNGQIAEHLLNASIYLEPDAPEQLIDQLLEHLLQWEIVYKLKYEYHVYDGPVFGGIAEFGFRGHPGNALDEYFAKAVRDLRRRHHERLQGS